MKYSITETKKGWVISVRENKKKCNYFLWDEEHTKAKYIEYILSYGDYSLGKPFGNGIHPIYLHDKAINRIDQVISPIGVFTQSFMKREIWKYYRSFITDSSPKKVIKQYADELKTNLSLLGLDGLYQFVQAQA